LGKNFRKLQGGFFGLTLYNDLDCPPVCLSVRHTVIVV